MEQVAQCQISGWVDLYPTLLLAAAGRVNRGYGGRLAALQPQDFVQTAIEKAMSGQRSFDPSKTLFENLCQIISSDVSNIVESYENKNVVNDDDKIVRLPSPGDHGRRAVEDQWIERFLSDLEAEDREAMQVAQLVLVGTAKSLELSIQLKCTVRDIENIKKRPRRFCERFVHQQQADSPPIVVKNMSQKLN